ncbi:Zeaxanthin epoxidase, chloroplastic [Hordeum vulgare]|nr:Zeaxanthin epoxidase, chloroplastic [Hordeum vulgare]KAI4968964.1 hypothetical protein ZWY2020_046294 [Hordeum vulgare]
MKQHVLARLRSSKVPAEALEVVERSDMSDPSAASLCYRSPLSLLFASISKRNVRVRPRRRAPPDDAGLGPGRLLRAGGRRHPGEMPHRRGPWWEG